MQGKSLNKYIEEWQDGDGVCYMLTGNKHASMLLVSLMSLRWHYKGPITIIAGDDAATEAVSHIVGDERISEGIDMKSWPAPVGGGKGRQHANKSSLLELSPYKRTVFLDADTMVVGRINEMLPRSGTEEIRLTQMVNWTTDMRVIKKRIVPWEQLLPARAALMKATPYPAINTGVIGFTDRSTRYFTQLKDLCLKNEIFMCDELVANLIFLDYPHVIMPHIYNYSCKFSEQVTPVSEARIIHFHGMKHVRTNIGKKLWVPLYDQAVRTNLGGVNEWSPGKDRQLKIFLANRNAP